MTIVPRHWGGWIFSAFTRTVIRCNPQHIAALERLNRKFTWSETVVLFGKQLAEALYTSRFIVDNGRDEIDDVKMQVALERSDDKTVGLVIAPTTDCNCSCHYCFEKDIKRAGLAMNAERTLELLRPQIQGKESVTLQWFGGEPLLEPDFVIGITDGLKKECKVIGAEFSCSMVTNGVLLSEEMCKNLSLVGVSKIQLTLEGDHEFHDRVRAAKGGQPTFEAIVGNMAIASAYFEISLRVHVAPYNFCSIERLLIDLQTRGVHQFIKEIYFAPLFDFKTTVIKKNFDHDNKRNLTNAVFAGYEPKLYRQAKTLGFPLPDLLEEGFDVCTAVRTNTLVVDSDGSFKKCYFDLGDNSYSYGSLAKGVSRQELVDDWRDFDLPRDAECAECNLLPTCLGGCSKKWQHGADKSVICDTLKFNLGDMLDVFYEEDMATANLSEATTQ